MANQPLLWPRKLPKLAK